MAEDTNPISGTLISAEKVRGTKVYNLTGELLGSIQDIIIDKISGRAIYGVMTFGGFVGIGEKRHPLPWSRMEYNPLMGGYVINLDKDRLNAAPSYEDSEEFKWTTDYGRTVDSYFEAPSEPREHIELRPFVGLRG
jgi:sporulation protein YlmC with PRC-barrel domain